MKDTIHFKDGTKAEITIEDFDKELKRILEEGFSDLKKGLSYYESTVPAIKSLIIQTIQSALPKENVKDDPEYSVDAYDFLADGYNQCLRDIRESLHKKGLEI